MSVRAVGNQEWIILIARFEQEKSKSKSRFEDLIRETGAIAKLSPKEGNHFEATRSFQSVLDGELPDLERYQQLHKLLIGVTESLGQTLIDRSEILNSGYGAIDAARGQKGIGHLISNSHYYLAEATKRLRDMPPVDIPSPKATPGATTSSPTSSCASGSTPPHVSPTSQDAPVTPSQSGPIPNPASDKTDKDEEPSDEFDLVEAPPRQPAPIPEQQTSPALQVTEGIVLEKGEELIVKDGDGFSTKSLTSLRSTLHNQLFDEAKAQEAAHQ